VDGLEGQLGGGCGGGRRGEPYRSGGGQHFGRGRCGGISWGLSGVSRWSVPLWCVTVDGR
jgi:hypothetical protein